MFNAYKEQLGDFVQDLINTYDPFLEQPEHLREVSDLEQFLRQRGFALSHPLHPKDLDNVRELRETLRSIWNNSNVDTMREQLNVLLSGEQLSLQLNDDMNWRFALDPETGLLQGIGVAAALGIALLLQEYGHERMRACASNPCRDVFVDTSRNKSRRFCSERCANRYNVAAFRGRQKDDGTEM
jgi:predicted RNA-binding Zn ribbon-like protein